MKLIKKLFKKNDWEKCRPPNWFDEYKLRRRVGFPKTFQIKGKTFQYKAILDKPVQQGGTLKTLYQFYRKKRRGKK